MFMPVVEVVSDTQRYISRPSLLDDLDSQEFFRRYRFSKENLKSIVDILGEENTSSFKRVLKAYLLSGTWPRALVHAFTFILFF